MISKSLELRDYCDIQEGLRTLELGLATMVGAGFKPYLPHEHRRWEYASAIQAYFDAFPRAQKTRALDIGCGSGPLGPVLALASATRVDEIDPDERLLKTRPEMFDSLGLATRVNFKVGDLTDIATTPYDAVFCISTIEHIPEAAQEAAWGNLAALVAPGGLLVVTTDFGASCEAPWDADTERVFKFDPDRVRGRARWLKDVGFDLDIDTMFHGPHVFNYTFFRFIARKV